MEFIIFAFIIPALIMTVFVAGFYLGGRVEIDGDCRRSLGTTFPTINETDKDPLIKNYLDDNYELKTENSLKRIERIRKDNILNYFVDGYRQQEIR